MLLFVDEGNAYAGHRVRNGATEEIVLIIGSLRICRHRVGFF